MGSREARVLAAGDSIDVVVGKKTKTYKLRPIGVQHLCDLEAEALRYYKRQYLRTFSDNADLLGKSGNGLVEAEMRRVARWDLHDLPQKDAYDVSRVPVTDELRAWVEEAYGEVPEEDREVLSLVSVSLDSEKLSSAELEKLSGRKPLKGRVRYDQWWVTASMNGMVLWIYTSVRYEHPEVTKEDVLRWPFSKIAEASRKVEALTSAEMGNM